MDLTFGPLKAETKATIFAEAYAEARMKFQANDKGVAGELGAQAGYGVGAELEGKISIGGVTVTATAGVSIGAQVGFDAGGGATYEDGVVSVSATFDLKFLVGVTIDLNLDIDIAELTDFAGDVGEFFTTDVANYANVAVDYLTAEFGDTAMTAINAVEDTARSVAKAAEDAAKAVQDAAIFAARVAEDAARAAAALFASLSGW